MHDHIITVALLLHLLSLPPSRNGAGQPLLVVEGEAGPQGTVPGHGQADHAAGRAGAAGHGLQGRAVRTGCQNDDVELSVRT